MRLLSLLSPLIGFVLGALLAYLLLLVLLPTQPYERTLQMMLYAGIIGAVVATRVVGRFRKIRR